MASGAPMSELDRLTGETVELLQQMIRNQCVNDGTPESGHEYRSVDVLKNELEGTGADIETWEFEPGRTSLLARLPGTDPDAPSLCLMGHTDVVPVELDGWTQDPFAGERLTTTTADGTEIEEIWGRGAVDMLNLTSSMAVAFRHIARQGRRPGDLMYFAVADEEAGGILGAQPIVDHHWDAIGCDYMLTEYGGTPSFGAEGTTVLITTAEKEGAFRSIDVTGTPGHGSMPYGTDNALVKAAAVVERLASAGIAPRIDEMFTDRIKALNLEPEVERQLLDPVHIADALAQLPPGLARNVHSCCHMTISPNMLDAGDKANTVASSARIIVDIRILPGQTQEEVDELLEAAIGPDLMTSCEITNMYPENAANVASSTDTPMWNAMTEAIQLSYPEARVVPSLVTGGTDARFFRPKGTQAYGAGLLSRHVPMGEFLNRFHGHDERIDIESLRLTTKLWLDVADRLWARH